MWYYDVYKTNCIRSLSDVNLDILNGLNISTIQYHLIMDYFGNMNCINNDGITDKGIKYVEENVLEKEQINTNVNKPLLEDMEYKRQYKAYLTWIAEVEFCKRAGIEHWIPFSLVSNIIKVSPSAACTIGNSLMQKGILKNTQTGTFVSSLYIDTFLNENLQIAYLKPEYKYTLQYFYNVFTTNPNRITRIHDQSEYYPSIERLVSDGYLYRNSVSDEFKLTHKGLVYCIFNFETMEFIKSKTNYTPLKICTGYEKPGHETPQHYSTWKEIFDRLPKKTTGKVENSGPSKETIDYIKTQQPNYNEQSENITGCGQNTYGQLGNSGAVRGRTYTHLIMDESPYLPNLNGSAYVNVDGDDLENELFLYYIDYIGTNVSIDPNDFTINNPILLLDESKIIQIFQTLDAREEIDIDINDIEHGFIEEDDVLQLAEYLSNNTKWECIYVVNKQIILSRVDISTQI